LRRRIEARGAEDGNDSRNKGERNMIALGILAVVVLGAGLWFMGTYNRLVRGRNLVEEAWSGIDVQLKRRHDLIPNLVETVKGYAAHEKQIFEDVARMRSASISASGVAEKAAAENGLTGALRQLFAVAEAYPDLKANQNFLQLQENLNAVESELQMARRYYNGAVRNQNILVESFPSNLVANMFAFQKAQFFEIEDAKERAVPKVQF
jgi:LemA protein